MNPAVLGPFLVLFSVAAVTPDVGEIRNWTAPPYWAPPATVGGGGMGTASGPFATVPGGYSKAAGGSSATVPGGIRILPRALTASLPAAAPTRLPTLPITEWRYRNETSAARHIGPMAQDFRAAFGLGDSDTSIGLIDANGVALAAIQGLNAKLQAHSREKDAEIEALRWALEGQRREFEALRRSMGVFQADAAEWRGGTGP